MMTIPKQVYAIKKGIEEEGNQRIHKRLPPPRQRAVLADCQGA
jgi:hypothetical protein